MDFLKRNAWKIGALVAGSSGLIYFVTKYNNAQKNKITIKYDTDLLDQDTVLELIHRSEANQIENISELFLQTRTERRHYIKQKNEYIEINDKFWNGYTQLINEEIQKLLKANNIERDMWEKSLEKSLKDTNENFESLASFFIKYIKNQLSAKKDLPIEDVKGLILYIMNYLQEVSSAGIFFQGSESEIQKQFYKAEALMWDICFSKFDVEEEDLLHAIKKYKNELEEVIEIFSKYSFKFSDFTYE